MVEPVFSISFRLRGIIINLPPSPFFPCVYPHSLRRIHVAELGWSKLGCYWWWCRRWWWCGCCCKNSLKWYSRIDVKASALDGSPNMLIFLLLLFFCSSSSVCFFFAFFMSISRAPISPLQGNLFVLILFEFKTVASVSLRHVSFCIQAAWLSNCTSIQEVASSSPAVGLP